MTPPRRGGLRQTLAPGLRQSVSLAPAMQVAMTLLRLPAMDLDAALAREASENPYLRWRPRQDGRFGRGGTTAVDAMAARPTVLERLRAQIGLMALRPSVRAAAEYLAAELREDGYLETPLAELSATLQVPETLLSEGLAALQGCEPAGVGARDLAECLALQLQDKGLSRPRADAVVAALERFVAQDWRGLEACLGLPRPELERIAALLPALVADPVLASEDFSVSFSGTDLVADLIAEPGPDGALVLRLGDGDHPTVTLDAQLMAIAPANPEAAAARARAQAVVAGLRARGTTLLRVADWLVKAQPGFVVHGDEHLRPLTRREVAEALGLHPSTVGRAVAGKGVALEGRLLPLSAFLSAPLPQSDGPALAGFAVRRRLARLIAEEPPEAPLSDEALRSALAAEGIDIARRTVAKYRDWMRVPSSFRRRRSASPRATPPGGAGGR